MIRSRGKCSRLTADGRTAARDAQRYGRSTQTETFGEVRSATSGGSALASVLGVRLDSQHAVQLLHRVAQQILQVADEAVDVALPRRLVDDVLVVVVAQASTQLLVVHLRLVFPLSPATGHLRIQHGFHQNVIVSEKRSFRGVSGFRGNVYRKAVIKK